MSKIRSYTLTAREEQVMKHLVLGLTAKEIGDAMGIKQYTVQAHVSNIHAKYGVHKTARAVALYLQQKSTPKV